MHRNSGLTLTELPAARSITTILVSIAVPSFSNMKKRSEMRGETNKILILLALAPSKSIKRARSESIKRSQVVTLVQEC